LPKRTQIAALKALATIPHQSITSSARRWIWDTGAGIDIISARCVANMKHLITKPANSLPIVTANGSAFAEQEILLKPTAMKEIVKPFVLGDSPPVLSVGWRCMELGYDFWWPAFQRPIITTPGGQTLTLEVDDYFPFLN
jgi:hypothetical protein